MEADAPDPHNTSVSSLGEGDELALQRLVFDMHQELEHLEIKRSKIFSRGVLARLDKLVARTTVYQEHKMKMTEQERIKAEKARQAQEEFERKKKENQEKERERLLKLKEKEEKERAKAEEEKKEREKKERLIREEKERLLKESQRKMIDEQRERERAAREKEAEVKAAERARLAAEAKEREKKEREVRETKLQKEREEKKRLEEELRTKEKERLEAERKRKEDERKRAESEKEALRRREKEAREAREKAAKEDAERKEKELEEKQKQWEERRKKKEEEDKARREKAQELIVQKERANREALERKEAEEKERKLKDQELKAADRQAMVEARMAAAAVKREAERAAREQKQAEVRSRREKVDADPDAKKPALPAAKPSTPRDSGPSKAKTPSAKAPANGRPSTAKTTPKQKETAVRPKTSPALATSRQSAAPKPSPASLAAPKSKKAETEADAPAPKVLKGRKKTGDAAAPPQSELHKLRTEWDAKVKTGAEDVIAALEARLGQLAAVDDEALSKHAGDMAAAAESFGLVRQLARPPSTTQEMIISLSAMLHGTGLDYKSSVGVLKEWDDTVAAVRAFDGANVTLETYDYVEHVAKTMDEDKLKRSSDYALPVLDWIRGVLPKVERHLLEGMLAGYRAHANGEVAAHAATDDVAPVDGANPLPSPFDSLPASVAQVFSSVCGPETLSQLEVDEGDPDTKKAAMENCIHILSDHLEQMTIEDKDSISDTLVQLVESDMPLVLKLKCPPSNICNLIEATGHLVGGQSSYREASEYMLRDWEGTMSKLRGFDGTSATKDAVDKCNRLIAKHTEEEMNRGAGKAGAMLRWLKLVMPLCERELVQAVLRRAAAGLTPEGGVEGGQVSYEEYAEA